MTYKYLLIVLSLLHFGCKSQVDEKIDYSVVSCDSLMHVAASNYEADEVNRTISFFQDAANCFISKEDSVKASYTFLNMATLNRERLKDYEEALHYAKKSKDINKNAFHTANVNKLIGLLYGELNEMDSSRLYFDLAERGFIELNAHKAVAVVNYDRAIVDFINNDLKSSKKWLEDAIAAFDDTQYNRLFVMNNFGILLGVEMKDSSLVRKCINRNNGLLEGNEVIKSNVDSFYVLERKYGSLR